MPGFTQTFCMSMTISAVRAGSSRSIACSLPPRRFVTRATMSGDSAILCVWGMDAVLFGVVENGMFRAIMPDCKGRVARAGPPSSFRLRPSGYGGQVETPATQVGHGRLAHYNH